jgi:hypothetical protein
LLDDSQAFCTTFFDFYGLPEDFPGKAEALALPNIEDKRRMVGDKLVEQLTRHIGDKAMRRFIPYVQMYEFEGLLFSKPEAIAAEIGEAGLSAQFERIRNAFDSPEHVNNSQETAPGKRIKGLFNQYDKVIHGSLVALEIGIAAMREECRLCARSSTSQCNSKNNLRELRGSISSRLHFHLFPLITRIHFMTGMIT